MNNGDHKSDTYQQYGYDQFDPQNQSYSQQLYAHQGGGQPPVDEEMNAEQEGLDMEPLIPYLVRNFIVKPLGSTTFLLLAASIITGTIVYSVMKDDGVSGDDIPVIQAEAGAIKEVPTEDGVKIPHRNSTIYATLRESENKTSKKIENLLESSNEKPVQDKVAAFDEKSEVLIENDTVSISAVPEEKPSVSAMAIEKVKPLIQVKTVKQEVEKIPPQALSKSNDVAVKSSAVEKPKAMHKPGSSPDTIAFVRSVLERKDKKGASGSDLANIAPAAGVASPSVATAVASGTYFVQLGSVSSTAGAHSEWGKLQKSFPAQLQQASYRVQEADLGAKGVYYRIQAGPMSKDSAYQVCSEIKAQKPGGCLVVK